MRGFSDADQVQANSGTDTAVSTETVTVGAGVTEGNAGLILMYTGGVGDTPDNWDPVVVSPAGGTLRVLLRAGLPGGESSWAFTSAAAGSWLWTVGEWGNFAAAPLQGVSSVSSGIAPASVSTGSTGTFTAQFVAGIAAFLITNGSAGGSAWPTVSYDSGFVQTDSLQTGTGAGIGDAMLTVARLYGADSDPGPWSCTATFTGAMTNKSVVACLAVFGAQETAAPALVLTP